MKRYQRLAALAWRDSCAQLSRLVLLSVGVAVGVAALLVFFAVGQGVEGALRHRLLGMLPDQVVVEPSSVNLAFVKVKAPCLEEATLERLRAVPGVRKVMRRVTVTMPTHLRAGFNGKSFYTDIVVEAIDPELVEGDVAASAFVHRGPQEPIPAVVPSVLLDILNLGFSVNTGLPQLNERMIIGRPFTANVGSSSFTVGPTISLQCECVGLSSKVGVGGPSIPIAYLDEIRARLAAQGAVVPAMGTTAAVLALESPARLESVLAAVRAMGLSTPQETRAAQVTAGVHAVSALLSLFGVLVLVVAGTGIVNGLNLMVRDETSEIGLLRAVGASRSDVLLLYLMRAGFVGLLGSTVGASLALVGCALLDRLGERLLPGLLGHGESVASPQLAHVALALGFGLLASLLAGALPARQASRIEPLAALRER
jgi:ABC-type lipoprotein release transport system permease subunit